MLDWENLGGVYDWAIWGIGDNQGTGIVNSLLSLVCHSKLLTTSITQTLGKSVHYTQFVSRILQKSKECPKG